MKWIFKTNPSRMKRTFSLSLILFGLMVLLALSTVWAKEKEGNSLSEELAVPRVVRSPEAGKQMKKKNGKGKKRSGKKKTANKAGKKAGKGKKRRTNKAGKKKKKAVKGEKRRANKAKKAERGRNRNVKNNETTSNIGDCLTRTVKIMKMWKDVITNFGRQKLRIERQNATGNNKLAKKDAFVPAYEKLVLVGGGDKNNLKCDNSTTINGAVQLKNITSFLGACQTEITKTCNTANWPQPDKTKLATCAELTKEFIIEAELCLDEMKQDTTAVCDCWNAASFTKTVEAVKDCKFSAEASAIAKAKEICTKNFGKCRKYEDDALLVIAACATGNAAIIKEVMRFFNKVLLF